MRVCDASARDAFSDAARAKMMMMKACVISRTRRRDDGHLPSSFIRSLGKGVVLEYVIVSSGSCPRRLRRVVRLFLGYFSPRLHKQLILFFGMYFQIVRVRYSSFLV